MNLISFFIFLSYIPHLSLGWTKHTAKKVYILPSSVFGVTAPKFSKYQTFFFSLRKLLLMMYGQADYRHQPAPENAVLQITGNLAPIPQELRLKHVDLLQAHTIRLLFDPF